MTDAELEPLAKRLAEGTNLDRTQALIRISHAVAHIESFAEELSKLDATERDALGAEWMGEDPVRKAAWGAVADKLASLATTSKQIAGTVAGGVSHAAKAGVAAADGAGKAAANAAGAAGKLGSQIAGKLGTKVGGARASTAAMAGRATGAVKSAAGAAAQKARDVDSAIAGFGRAKGSAIADRRWYKSGAGVAADAKSRTTWATQRRMGVPEGSGAALRGQAYEAARSRFIGRGGSVGSGAARGAAYGGALAAGGGLAAALSQRQREQRSVAGKASAEKRRGFAKADHDLDLMKALPANLREEFPLLTKAEQAAHLDDVADLATEWLAIHEQLVAEGASLEKMEVVAQDFLLSGDVETKRNLPKLLLTKGFEDASKILAKSLTSRLATSVVGGLADGVRSLPSRAVQAAKQSAKGVGQWDRKVSQKVGLRPGFAERRAAYGPARNRGQSVAAMKPGATKESVIAAGRDYGKRGGSTLKRKYGLRTAGAIAVAPFAGATVAAAGIGLHELSRRGKRDQ